MFVSELAMFLSCGGMVVSGRLVMMFTRWMFR
jgi:hypothetical protein